MAAEAQSPFGHIDSLYQSGSYLAARVACERVLFTSDVPENQFRAAVGKTRCLKQQGLYDQALLFLNRHLQTPYADSLLYQLRHEQVMCAYLAGQFENVLSLVDRLPYLHPDRPVTPLLAAVRVLSFNELRRWPEARQAYGELVMRVQADTSVLALYRQVPVLKQEKKAQWLSTFIPGAGQLYAGKPIEAAVSLLVQAAGLYIGVTSFLNQYYLTAWGVGAGLFGSFHSGGVRRAEVLVQQYNGRKTAAFNAKARQQILQLIR